MQPTLCSRCKKNVAVVFISKMEGDKTTNEGLCLKCAKELGLPQVDDMMKRMGISNEDLDTLNNEMLQAMSGVENIEDLPGGEDAGEEEEEGKTATFPFLNRLFSGEAAKGGESGGQEESGARSRDPLDLQQAVGRLVQCGIGDRPGAGDRAGGADPEPPPEEQPLPDR